MKKFKITEVLLPYGRVKRIMKITFFLLFATLIQLSATSSAQNKRLSMNVEGMTIKEVLNTIEAQTEFTFFYNNEQININRKIGENFKNTTITDILNQVLIKNGIDYKVQGQQIVLSPESANEVKIAPKQNTKTIKGKVLDENGDPLPGSTIQINGTTRGVMTDTDGSYSIEALSTDQLDISFVGYQTYSVIVGEQTEITVALTPKVNELDEVTVVAFAKQKKESVLASITTVNPSELKIPSSNLTTALAGRISGLISYQTSGEPGMDDANFFVRGVTTFDYAGAGPLILIDGVEMTSTDLARLQPDDIAAFSVMKDATAAALYGARGANGVILVTTKEGREGPATISIRYETSISRPTKDIDLVDPITYMQMNNEAVLTRNKIGMIPYSLEKIGNTIAGKNPMVYPATDWRDMLIKDQTFNHRLNFHLSGGGKVARYYVAATYNQDNGVLKVDKRNNFNSNIDLKRYLLRSNININVTPTTEVVIRLHGTFDDYSGPLDGGSDLYKKILRTDPALFPAYFTPDSAHLSKKHILFGNYDNGNYINPYADMVKGYKEYSKTTVLAQVELKQKLDFFLEGLSLRGLFNTTRYSYFDVSRSYNPFYYAVAGYDKYEDTYVLTGLNPSGTNGGTDYLTYSEGQKDVNSVIYFEGAINYDQTFAEKHGVSGLLVFTLREKLEGNAGSLTSFLPMRNVGLSGRFTYNYDSRYFGEFNFGYNGSERFAKNERFGFFPSAAVGWILSNESFWGNSLKKYVNMFKLKGTYGLVGNDAIGNTNQRFFYLSEVSMNNASYAYTWGEELNYSVPGISISKYANELITWERSTKMNLGIEAKLFNMVDLQVDYYRERRKNILLSRASIPKSMGLMGADPQSNLGVAKAHGVDLSVDIQKNITPDWWISGRGNLTYAVSQYDEYEEVEYTNMPWLSKIGQSVSQQWGLIAERLFVDEEEVANSPAQFNGGYMAGDIKYRDINRDGLITDEDKVPIGFPTEPQIIYGFGLSTGYKGFDFSFFFQGLAQRSFWIDATNTAPFIDTDDDTKVISKNAMLQVYADDYWSEENRNLYALWPRLSDQMIDNNVQRSTWFMRDGSFLRLKSVEFGYSLPENWIKRISMKTCRFYFSGTNLLTFSNFKLWDPEMAGNGLSYPIQKVYNFGVQVTF
ncbi:MAG: TonB-dependent receptor [Bacteroidales bacterium]|jgi:TonB-linked SusC/RagA family outer membrane protein|nr:TonB-dependent receptor [Bacteroidales bacterium]